MNLQDKIINHFTDSIQTQQESLASLCELIEIAGQRLVECLLNDRKILSCGNGRSAVSARLMSCLMVNQYERDRPSLPCITLAADAISLTAIANDYHFDDIFAKPLRALGQSGDVLLVFSDTHSGSNLAKAINSAHDKEIVVIALTGHQETKISSLLRETDIEIRVPSYSSTHIQEVHIMITHCLCDLIDQQLFGSTL